MLQEFETSSEDLNLKKTKEVMRNHEHGIIVITN